ncbi:MAG TPA: cyclopropane-fatty-acyl-phospholipid synthase family protein [Gemmatimonadaceae bacterium]|nr:cyclopropane-fatty-acyl-phospholipid synthase family protein [Gemmatimonadaceae bacterium]
MPTLHDLSHEPGHTSLPVEPPRWADGALKTAQRIVEALFGPPLTRDFTVRYWNGMVEWPAHEARFTLDIRTPAALRRMLLPPSELSFVEAYLYGDIDIDGDIEGAVALGDLAASRIGSAAKVVALSRDAMSLPRGDGDAHAEHGRVARGLLRFGRAHSQRRDAQAVRFHYDLGNDFYAMWLDRQMVYSCGYFPQGNESLDDGQSGKLDLICRKLRLSAGERMLDIGCGWGALAIHAATRYDVHATGITLSERQAAYARERVAREGLSDRVTIELRDYRDLPRTGSYDKISSVGMIEHVGEGRLDEYFDAAFHALRPGGLFLNHGIVSVEAARPSSKMDAVWARLWKRGAFIDRYVFPDGELVPIATVIAAAERNGFELRDAENLREHYVTTLRHWVDRLEHHDAEARALVGEVTYRVWRLYMAASAYAFDTGRIGIVQSLLAKVDEHGNTSAPRSRADLYLNG